MTDMAALGAAGVLAGEGQVAIQFRRDSLAPPEPLRRVRGPLTLAVVAAAGAGLSLAASMLAVARAYDARVSQCQSLDRAFYRQGLGTQASPDARVTAELAREARRLQALSGTLGPPATASRGPSVPAAAPFRRPRSALRMLADVLEALPRDVRFRITDLQLSPEQVQVEGQGRTHGDADAIADGLRGLGGYAVDPPHSEVHGSTPGVSFTVIARVVEVPPEGPPRSGGRGR